MAKNQRAVLGFVCLLIAAVAGFALKSRAAVVTNIDIPLSGVLSNPCNGENVTFSGTDHFTLHITFNSAGGINAVAHDNIHVTASGDQGNSYVGNQEDSNVLNARVGAEQTMTLIFSEISQTKAPNFEVHAIAHVTINANGSVTASVNNFTAVCRG